MEFKKKKEFWIKHVETDDIKNDQIKLFHLIGKKF